MGPLFGHMARDPEPARVMKLRAPRVYRWTESMNTPEIVAPEYADFEEAYLPDDEVPETVLDLLRFLLPDGGAILAQTHAHYEAWAAENAELASGSVISERAPDEGPVGRFEPTVRGVPMPTTASSYNLWIWQRGLDWFATLGPDAQKACRELLASCGAEGLLALVPSRRIARVENQMVVA